MSGKLRWWFAAAAALGAVLLAWPRLANDPSPPAAKLETSAALPAPEVALADPAPGQDPAAAPGVLVRSDTARFPAAPVRLGRAGIHGRVIHRDGSSAPCVSVRAEYLYGPSAGSDVRCGKSRTVSAGAGGEFAFDELSFGVYRVRAMAPGLVAYALVRCTSAEPLVEVTLELGRSGSIGGVVTNSAGDAIDGAQVYWADPRADAVSDKFGVPVFPATTGATGEFLIEHLRDGEGHLAVEAPEYVRAEIPEVATGTLDLRIVLDGLARLSGTVVAAEDGRGVAVQLRLLDAAGLGGDANTESATDGRFAFAGVPPGEWRPAIWPGRYVMFEEAPIISLRESESLSGIRLVVTTGATISGRVHDCESGVGVPGAMVHARARVPDGASIDRDARTDAEGRYRVEGLVAGSWSVFRGATPNYAMGEWQDFVVVAIEPGSEVSGVDYPVSKGVAVRGEVRSDYETPLLAVKVSAWVDGAERSNRTTSGSEGRFELIGLEPGERVLLIVSHPGWATTWVGPLEPGPDGIDGLLVEMLSEGSISGMVVDDTGHPIANAQVECTTDEGRWVGTAFTSMEAESEFRIGQLGPGVYRLLPGDIRVVLGKSEHRQRVMLVASHDSRERIAGRVIDARGLPIGRAEVGLHDRADHWAGIINVGFTDDLGQFRLGRVADGHHDVSVWHPSYATALIPQVPAGNEALEIVLSAGGNLSGSVLDAQTGAAVVRFDLYNAAGTLHELTPVLAAQRLRIHDARGRFHLAHVAPGTTTLLVRADSYDERFITGIVVPEGEDASPVDVYLDRAR